MLRVKSGHIFEINLLLLLPRGVIYQRNSPNLSKGWGYFNMI